MPQTLINTQALVILIINLFLIFSIFEQKKIGNFVRVAFEATRFVLPARWPNQNSTAFIESEKSHAGT